MNDETKTGTATYSPEDNKLRLYVGRVPRPEYDKLRAQGWISTPKQSCDFVAVWTPERRDTALEYAGIIEDEDQNPEDRAADRAERFGEYRDKRTEEATGHADRYDAGPSAHGYQNQARAERSAARHDRIASRACDAWSKAEYWQRRTAGVISHALYKSRPDVRMGRIKTIESELRKHEKSLNEYAAVYSDMQKIAAIENPEAQTAAALHYVGTRNIWANYMHPRASEHPKPYYRENKVSLYSLLSDEALPITGKQAVELFFSNHSQPETEDDWTRHYKLRLAYENQMLEAQGGRAAHVEMIPGGFIGGKQIHKVNKSPATGRVVSVQVMGTHTGFTRESGYKQQGTWDCLVTIETERLAASAYRAPTEEELNAFHDAKKAAKAAAPKKEPCPLINPTDADAERLIGLWNERRKAEYEKSEARHFAAFKPSTIERVPQRVYSANSKGNHARAETRGLCKDGKLESRFSEMWSSAAEKRAQERGAAVFNIRIAGYDRFGVFIITDKPQKPLPAAVWEKYAPAPATPQTASQAELMTA